MSAPCTPSKHSDADYSPTTEVSGRRRTTPLATKSPSLRRTFTISVSGLADVGVPTSGPVYDHDELGKDDLWATIRSKVVELLDQRNIKHSSVDLVRFSWVEENEDVEENRDDEDDEDIEDIEDVDTKVAPYGTVVTTPVTIWVGVVPDTLTGEVAFRSSNDILDLLERGFSGLELFEPVSDLDPLKAVIDPMTTALGLPIADLKTLKIQGTMGFYFRVDQNLYAVTARHVLFPDDEGNNPYFYVAGPKKEVVLMGTRAFTNFFISIQGHIGTLNNTVGVLEKRVTVFTARSEGGGPNAEQAAGELVETQRELNKTRTAIEELKTFFVKMKKRWTKPKDRVIGHVVWAPPVSVSTAPHSYTKDVCVVELDKKKFSQNFRGNVLDLGPEIDAAKFIGLMYPRINAPSDCHYPAERLLKSHVRRYFTLGNCNSVEAAVYAYNNDSGPFSRGGDSGSIIVDARGKFAALTGGTGPTHSPDITFGTPMYWLWDIIKAEFPGANLYFEDNDH
ncbi:hypothetical protein F5I97DRAFT_1939188 [Phlebopus sp. FC_14]|nr:hypothetical protein F5I97DRAFT_1939188 [Phlebopus sp. FC_14]